MYKMILKPNINKYYLYLNNCIAEFQLNKLNKDLSIEKSLKLITLETWKRCKWIKLENVIFVITTRSF